MVIYISIAYFFFELLNLKLILRILQPEAYFSPSGGSILSGKYSILNKYVAVPSYSRIIEFLKNENYKIFDIAGGGKIIRKKRKWVLIRILYKPYIILHHISDLERTI